MRRLFKIKYNFLNGGSNNSNLDEAISNDILSIQQNNYNIDIKFKNLLKDQMKQYIDILKKLELNKFKQTPPTKIEDNDLIKNGDKIYEDIKYNFYNNIDVYDKEFSDIINMNFENNIPLVRMMQKMSIKTYNNIYLPFSDGIFFDGKNAEHWYLLPKEYNERFSKKAPDLFRLNRYLGLSPFHDLEFIIDSEGKIKINDTIGIHYCYVFVNYLSSPKKNMFPTNDNISKELLWEWHTGKFHEFLEEKYENKMFKCFCNFLEKKLTFNKRLDNIFKEYEGNNNKESFIQELNSLINNYGEWDLVVWSIPWSGEGRTLDYGIDIENKFIINGGSEFFIPEGTYLRHNFTPILTETFEPL